MTISLFSIERKIDSDCNVAPFTILRIMVMISPLLNLHLESSYTCIEVNIYFALNIITHCL